MPLGFNISNSQIQDDSLNIYMVLPEASPIVQTSGLGEVGEGLPNKLAELGHRVHVCIPKHTGALENAVRMGLSPLYMKNTKGHSEIFIGEKAYHPAVFRFWMDAAKRLSYDLIGTDCFSVFDNKKYRNLYNHSDNYMRFMLFDRIAASRIIPKPNTVVHGHDWQAGHLHTELKTRYLAKNLPTLHTIHNLKYRDTVSLDEFYRLTGLTNTDYPSLYTENGIKFPFEDKADPTQAALSTADYVNTVSEQYTKETLGSFGEGFSHILNKRFAEGRYSGIVNGVGDN